MHRIKWLPLGLLAAWLLGGLWLLWRPATLGVESASRQQAIRALAPAGQDAGQSPAPHAPTGQATTLPPVAPVTIDFAEVLISTNDPDSLYERWRRGEVDLAENESLLSERELGALRDAARRLPPDPTVQRVPGAASPNAPTPAGSAFPSLDYNDSGGWVPPDAELAVGPDHLIAVVNVTIEIYDKSGATRFGPTAAIHLFSQPPCTGDLFDPNVLYDEEADRWLLAYAQGSQSATGGYCVLASQSGDPTSTWNEYFFPLNAGGAWLDFPRMGVGDEWIVMGGNMFVIGGGFSEARLFAFRKADLYAGNPTSAVAQGLGPSASMPQPLRLHGANVGTWPAHGSEHYVLADRYNGQHYELYRWNPATAMLVLVGTVDLGVGGMALPVPQQGGADIQGNDYRLLDFEYRNGYGWTTQTVACNPGGGAVNCIRWAQISLADASLGPAGSGTYGSRRAYRTFPNLAVNHCGDMVVGYTKSRSNMFPAVWYTGRASDDAPGTLQAEAELKAGEIAYTAFDPAPHRWGDYSGMTVDPDGTTFWYLGQYSQDTGNANGRWGTFVGSFHFPTCVAAGFNLDVAPSSAAACSPAPAHYAINVSALGGFASAVALSTSGTPTGATATFNAPAVTPPGSSVLTIGTSALAPGSYPFSVLGASGTLHQQRLLTLDVADAVPAAPLLSAPSDGATAIPGTPTLEWAAVAGATRYTVELASDPAFASLVETATLSDTRHIPATALGADTVYYWRVRASNACGHTLSATHAFHTEAIRCTTHASSDVPKAISATGTPTVQSQLSTPDQGFIRDVNVLGLNGTHSWISDLDFRLRAPDGTVVQIMGQTCGDQDNFDLNLDDEAAGDAGGWPCPPIGGGTYQPSVPLAGFDGLDARGTWTLIVRDNAAPDGGALEGWGLEICRTAPTATDYSDLASGYGVAWHTGDGTLRLGSAWDSDSSFASGADDGSDDGVTVDITTDWRPGGSSTATLLVTGGSGYAAGWFDWNHDGDFADAGEQAIGAPVVAGPNAIPFAIPAGAVVHLPVKGRFRLYDAAPQGLLDAEAPTGSATRGEVEDFETFGPLVVQVAAFDATPQGASILVTWETSSEIGNLGFNLLRGPDAAGPTEQLNPALIPSQAPGSGQGAAYEWLDEAVQPGATYFYWLETVDVAGGTERFGPASATGSSPTAIALAGLSSRAAPSAPVPGLALLALALLASVARRRRAGRHQVASRA